MKISNYLAMVLILSGISGCVSPLPPLALPLTPSPQTQLTLTRLEQILLNENLDDNMLAQLYYERGVLHDSLGLRDRAIWDLKQSLKLKPNQANVYNVLGVHFTQVQYWDAAFDAFDSALELDPNHEYALRNRGIALYYSGRLALAKEDLQAHYEKDIHNPYRAIWLYWVEREQFSVQANKNLLDRLKASDREAWGWQIVQYYLGELSESELLFGIERTTKTNKVLAERLTEAYFYLAKDAQYQGDLPRAYAWLTRTLSANVVGFIEYRYVPLELARLSALKHQ